MPLDDEDGRAPGGRPRSFDVKKAVIAAGLVLVIGVGALIAVNKTGLLDKVPLIGALVDPPDPVCPLTGRRPSRPALLERPALAVKVENLPLAYPDSGLEKADIVIEEPVEGGLTRFIAIYHCGDARKVGPIRSSRPTDPALIGPITRIIAAAGGNYEDRRALEEADMISIDEPGAGDAMQRIDRPGIAFEHTLYGATKALRRLGAKSYEEPPPSVFEFGDLPEGARAAKSVELSWQNVTRVGYKWIDGRWMRFADTEPFLTDTGKQIGVDNILVEEHTVDFSTTNVDVLGAPSTIIRDVIGSGRAFLFRDGRVVRGRWMRESETDAVRFETRDGDTMQLRAGRTWIEVLPDRKGEAKGYLEYS